jgi:hypothetical protein
VSAGVDVNTVEFAVETLHRWWRQVGSQVLPEATELLIIAEAGDLMGSQDHLGMAALQRLADQSGLQLSINHFPPGTSRWSTITHRMLCQTATTWPGTPPVSHSVLVNLIGEAPAAIASPVAVEVGAGTTPPEVPVKEEGGKAVKAERETLHGDWNFTITPRP